MSAQTVSFVVVTFFSPFFSPKSIKKTIGKVCRPRFIALLLRVPCTPVLQTTASVMPERSKPPNLAWKRNSKSPFSQLSHTNPKEITHLLVCVNWTRDATWLLFQLLPRKPFENKQFIEHHEVLWKCVWTNSKACSPWSSIAFSDPKNKKVGPAQILVNSNTKS